MLHGIKTLRECACEELAKVKKQEAKEANSVTTHSKLIQRKRLRKSRQQ